jgi:MOSC domain-containing protein YiiM
MWEGTVVSIHIAAEASAPMQSISEIRAFPGRGLQGDRYFAETGFYSKKSSHGGREVTLIEIEAVEALFGGVRNAEGERFGLKLAASSTRRNIATSGVPLNHLVDREFWLGAVLMRGTRLCEPCKHLDDLTQRGVMSGLIHRGGLRAQILSEGVIRVGDNVRPEP